MSTSATTFYLFPHLPLEIRKEIWLLCLPHRVCELDTPEPELTLTHHPLGPPHVCELSHTTRLNLRPPVISRVCYESRGVALKAGRTINFIHQDLYGLSVASWSSHNRISEGWRDLARNSPHVHWHKRSFGCTHGVFHSPRGGALRCLDSAARDCKRTGSLTLASLSSLCWTGPPPGLPWFAAFGPPAFGRRQLDPAEAYLRSEVFCRMVMFEPISNWNIVMRTVVIHSDLESARKTGLFGLLGDAYVQIIEPHDPKTSLLLDFAKQCESGHAVKVSQDFTLPTTEELNQELEQAMMIDCEDQAKQLTPVIMFRLCPLMCNRVDVETSVEYPCVHRAIFAWQNHLSPHPWQRAGSSAGVRGLRAGRVPRGGFRGRGRA